MLEREACMELPMMDYSLVISFTQYTAAFGCWRVSLLVEGCNFSFGEEK